MKLQLYLDNKTFYLNLQNAGGKKTAETTFKSESNRNKILSIISTDDYFTNEQTNIDDSKKIEIAFDRIKSVSDKIIDDAVKYYLNNGLGNPNSLKNLEKFETATQKLSILGKNIKDYKTLDDMEHYIGENKFKLEIFEIDSKMRRKTPPPPKIGVDYKIELQSDKTIIYEILSLYGSIYYGHQTKWCTSPRTEQNAYYTYSVKGPIYVIKSIDKGKYQLQNESAQLMNKDDIPVIIRYLKELFDDTKFNVWVQKKMDEYYNKEKEKEEEKENEGEFDLFDYLNGDSPDDSQHNGYTVYTYKDLDALLNQHEIVNLTVGIKITPFTDLNIILSGMTNLKNLTITPGINDLEPVSRLLSLEKLSVGQHKLSDIKLLGGLENLVELDISNGPHNNNLNIGVLSNLRKLKKLVLSNNKLTTFTPLNSQSDLEEPQTANSKIADIRPLSVLINLEELYIDHTNISDITPLGSLINLKKLVMNNKNLTTITPLSGLSGLEELHIEGTNISDITPLGSLIKLKKLVMNDNKLTTIAPLSRLSGLVELHIVNCPDIEDIKLVNNMPKLEKLYVGGHNVFDISDVNSRPTLEIVNVVYEKDILAEE